MPWQHQAGRCTGWYSEGLGIRDWGLGAGDEGDGHLARLAGAQTFLSVTKRSTDIPVCVRLFVVKEREVWGVGRESEI